MKIAARVLFCLGPIVLTGCLTTRAELREAEGRRTQVSAAQEHRAQEIARLDEMESQMRAVNGRMDVIENHLNQLDAGRAERQTGDQRQREEGEKRLRAYEEALNRMEQTIAGLSEEIRAMKVRKETLEAPPSKDAYQRAEDAFNQKEFKQAIVEYENYRKANPKGKSYPAATFKIGMAFHELKMRDEAKAFFEEVVAKYPSSKEAKKASQRLKAMK